MACACKNSKKIERLLIDDINKYENKGVIGALKRFNISFINKLVVFVLLIVMIPIVMIVVIFNFTFHNKLMVTIPKFMLNKSKNKEENE